MISSFGIARCKRLALAACAALALGLLGSCATAPTAAYATLEAVVIDAQRAARPDELALVRVWRGNALLRTEARMPLQRGDLVMTGPRAYAVLHYATADVLMRPDSQGRVGSLTEVIGAVFTKLRGVFSVETSFMRAGANSTAYLVRADAGGTAVVTVFDGTVTLSSPLNAWAPQFLARGLTALCTPRSPPQVQTASIEELEFTRRWVEGVERASPPRSRYGAVAAVAVIGVLVGAILADRGGRDRPTDRGPAGGDARGRTGPQGTPGGAAPSPGTTDAAGRPTTVQPTPRYPARDRTPVTPPTPGPVVR